MEDSETFSVTLHEGPKGCPNLVFSWKVPQNTCETLRGYDADKPLLLAMATRPLKEDSDAIPDLDAWALYPLHKGMGSLQLALPGSYALYFMVVWDHYYYGLGPGASSAYAQDVYDYFRMALGNPTLRGCPKLDHVEKALVQVSPDYFLPKPSSFGLWWTNLAFSNPPLNSCAYKQRLWLITLPQAIILPGFVLFRALVIVATALGLLSIASRPRLSPLWHPFSQSWTLVYRGGFAFCWNPQSLARLPIIWLCLGGVLSLIPLVPLLVGFLSAAFAILVSALVVYVMPRVPSLKNRQRHVKVPKAPSSLALWYASYKQRKCLPYKEDF